MFDRFHDEAIHLERTVEMFCDEVGLTMRNPRRFGGTGEARSPRTARREQLLFAGEAAGFQDPLWGFGMRYAMVSGGLAARALLAGAPASYDRLWKRRLGGFMRAAVVNRWAYERLGDSRYEPFLRRIERAPDPREWLRRFYTPALWKSLLYPLAARRVSTALGDAACVEDGCECTWCRCHRVAERSEGREPVRSEKGDVAHA
jgi:hypothetical protein